MNLHRLDLVSLSLFTAIVRTGSISRGAQLSNLAVGAASKRVSDLEAAVETELLARHSRGVTLTAAGQALYRHAERILGDVDRLAVDLADYAAGIVGVVSLSANTSAVTQSLPMELASFLHANPGIRVELEEQNSDEVVMAVLNGQADFGIFADRTPSLGLQTQVYLKDTLVLVVAAGHPLAERSTIRFEEAMDFDFVSLGQGTSLAKRMALASEAASKRLKLRIRVRSFDAICQMVSAGLGVAVLPETAARPHLVSMNLRKVDIEDDWVHRELLIGARDMNALIGPPRLLFDHLIRSGKA